MVKQLEGKVAVITGAARGMGEASVRRFVEEGAQVVMADVLDEEAEALATELGDAVIYQHTDVSQSEQVEALVATAVSHFGTVDVMFSNAGVMGDPQKDFLAEDFTSFERTIGINLLGPMLGAHFAAKHMAQNGGGCILTTASSSALYGGHSIVPYRASKAGIIGMTKALAIDLGRYGIRVNSISPGPTRTPMTLAMDDLPEEHAEAFIDVAMESMRSRMPLGRLGLPEDIANAAVFLASDQAAQITGVDLPVDGGETAGNCENTL
ncbi:MAG: SDR family oxidoreductase, partial [Pseudomonadota bacterium]